VVSQVCFRDQQTHRHEEYLTESNYSSVIISIASSIVKDKSLSIVTECLIYPSAKKNCDKIREIVTISKMLNYSLLFLYVHDTHFNKY
jgi:hypothetical protein